MQQRHAPENAVGIGSGVQETRSARGLRQHRQAAHDAGGVKERRVTSFLSRMNEREGDRMQHARARLGWGVVECHRVAEHDATLAKRRGQRIVEVAAALRSEPSGWSHRDRRSDRVRRR